MFAIITLSILSIIGLASIAGTISMTLRDGYRAIPTRPVY